MSNNILIVAPHCDDEVLGCGGIIAKYTSLGKNVYVAIITNGHLGAPELFKKEGTKKVRGEAVKSHQFLGVKETFFLDFPAIRLDTTPAYQISLKLSELVKKLNIDTLYVPHRGDIHKDHRITFEASIVVARPLEGNTIKRVYAYETLSETEWAPPFGDDAFIPTVFEDITGFLEKKQKAFEFFTTQFKTFPHPRSLKGIEALANFRGATIGVECAEAFMLIREIK